MACPAYMRHVFTSRFHVTFCCHVTVSITNANKVLYSYERNASLHYRLFSLRCFSGHFHIGLYSNSAIHSEHSMAFLCFFTQSSCPVGVLGNSQGLPVSGSMLHRSVRYTPVANVYMHTSRGGGGG